MNLDKPSDLNLLPELPAGKILKMMRSGRWYEQEMLNYITSLGLRGCYIDVGAHIGNHSLYFAYNTKAEHIYSFEASKGALSTLMSLISANSLADKITVVPFAASDIEGDVLIDTGGKASVKELVRSKRIDDTVHTPISLIKMDIEGAEPAAIRGALNIIKQYKPVLFIEIHSAALMSEIGALLSPLGYATTGKVWNASPTYEFAAS